MAALSLRHHMERSHRIFIPQTGGVDLGRGVTETYVMSFPRVLNSVACPVDGCLTRAHNLVRLREHFVYRHWNSNVEILQVGPEPFPQ